MRRLFIETTKPPTYLFSKSKFSKSTETKFHGRSSIPRRYPLNHLQISQPSQCLATPSGDRRCVCRFGEGTSRSNSQSPQHQNRKTITKKYRNSKNVIKIWNLYRKDFALQGEIHPNATEASRLKLWASLCITLAFARSRPTRPQELGIVGENRPRIALSIATKCREAETSRNRGALKCETGTDWPPLRIVNENCTGYGRSLRAFHISITR